jgi:predicted metalloprotease with PDZ domain
MTEATLTQLSSLNGIAPTINYQVAIPEPESHLFEVTLHLKDWQLPILDLKMPVWTPGSYLVREYAKHLQDFSVQAGEQTLPWRKLSKNHWQVETIATQARGSRQDERLEARDNREDTITVRYRVFAHELSVRTNHLDATHGYFNGAALFFRIPGFEQQSIRVTIEPPQQKWRVTTPLPSNSR